MTIFGSLSFFLFVALSVPLFYLAPPRARYAVIFLGGIAFYAWNATWWVVLFFSELLISRFYRKGSAACWVGAAQALLVLGLFKYGAFFEDNARWLCGAEPGRLAPVLAVLPLAISFFTFEFVHFAVDSHQGRAGERDFLKYGAFIFYFPTLVAGPIKRYQDFTPKVEAARFDWGNISAGTTRILLGFFKKLVIADSMVEWTKFLAPDVLPGLSPALVWQGVLAYGARIYFDFSGYADIAIGTSVLFGIAVPENFNNPYASRNISEFWKRWHISLYRWLVDYIYIPLGGSRCGRGRVCLNILVVTSASGLWHGASWHFLFWGWYHGLLLCGYHLWQSRRPPDAPPRGLLWRAAATALTFALAMFGWVFFALDTRLIPLALKKMFLLG